MTTATKNRVTDLDTTRQKLQQMRDELKLKMNLAKADARDEWRELEAKWDRFEAKLEGVGRQTGDTADKIRADLKDVADDLRHGYERIRKSL